MTQPTPSDLQSLQRTIMAMNSGCCPSCGVITAPGGYRADVLAQPDFAEFHGLWCDLCNFQITDVQIEAVRVMKPMAADLETWQTWAAAGPK